MTEEELLGLIREYETASLGSSVAAGATVSSVSNQEMTTLEIDRYNALNGYFARPLGNEVENRSQVVLPEFRDTVEWIKPQIMRMFVAAKTVCRFEPEGPDDESQAEQETLIVNHVFMQENNGFFVLHDFFTDALLMRNGYVSVDWKEKQRVTIERYTGLTEIEVTQLLQDKEGEKIEVIEQKEYTKEVLLPLPPIGPQGLPPGMPPPQVSMQVTVFDVTLRLTGKESGVRVECLPPEEMRVSAKARQGMEDIPFSAHVTEKSRSDLIAEGFDEAIVSQASAGKPNWMELDALARNQVVDQMSTENPSDRAMQEIETRRVIVKVDFDGDGLAELRRVVVVGDKIAENEIIEETPFASCAPKRMPHRHTGISLYDEIIDLQFIKSELMRGGLDNLKLAMNQRTAVDYNSVNLDDLMTSRPGGLVRGKGPPANWIMPIPSPSNLMDLVLPAMGYIDELKTTRTGIGKGQMTPDPDDLQDVTKGAQLAAMSAAALKVEMLARLLAEGVKDIFRKIHSELLRNQNKPLDFQISGKWVQVNPASWRRRTKVVANVGLGSGNREEMRTNVQVLTQAQMALAQMGLVGPKQAYETFKMMVEALGFNSPERFAMDPQSPEYQQHMKEMASQPPQQAPQVQAAQIRAQTTVQQEQAENQRLLLKMQADQQKGNNQLVHEAIQNQQGRAHENTQNSQQASHEHLQGHKDREIALDASHERMTETLIKAFAQILAAEKAKPEELAPAVEQADEEIEKVDPHQERMMQLLEGLHGAISQLGGPRTATLSDGRKITIQ